MQTLEQFVATFPEYIDTFLRKLTDGTFVHKVHKVHRLLSKDALPLHFSAITTDFRPLYYLLFGILYAIFPCV